MADTKLSPRQAEVARLTAHGKTYKEIAEIMGIGRETVRTNIYWIKQKTGARNQVEIALWVERGGLEE